MYVYPAPVSKPKEKGNVCVCLQVTWTTSLKKENDVCINFAVIIISKSAHPIIPAYLLSWSTASNAEEGNTKTWNLWFRYLFLPLSLHAVSSSHMFASIYRRKEEMGMMIQNNKKCWNAYKSACFLEDAFRLVFYFFAEWRISIISIFMCGTELAFDIML